MMEYRKTGRGGAGNYYTQENLDKITKPTGKGKDLEASKDNRPPALQPPERQNSFALTGRGGVGNLTDKESLAKSTVQSTNLTPGMQERKPLKTGYLGRGGVGNYKDEDAEKAASQAQAARRASESAERNHQEAVEMVDMTMKEPEPAHLSREEGDM